VRNKNEILIVRREEKEYKKWLSGQKSELSDDRSKSELKPLRDFWSSDKLVWIL
jgi:hypothetical protein